MRSNTETIKRTRLVVSGPRAITADYVNGGLHFYGWQVMCLTLLNADTGHYESWSAYANLGDQQQPRHDVAILRHTRAVLRSYAQAKSEPSLAGQTMISVPGKHVWLPLTRVQEWMGRFEHTCIQIGTSDDADDRVYVNVRLDRNWQSGVFEKRWVLGSTAEVALEEIWTAVRADMVKHLTASDAEIVAFDAIREIWDSMPIIPPIRYITADIIS